MTQVAPFGEPFQVRITKPNRPHVWYHDYVGVEVTVERYHYRDMDDCYIVVEGRWKDYLIRDTDCEILTPTAGGTTGEAR